MRDLPVAILLMWGLHSFAQDKSPVKFGKVTPADFAIPIPGGDTAADVVVISDVGILTFGRRNLSGVGWDNYLEHTKRVLILKRRGFEAATVTIPLQEFRSESEEISGLKAATYNLENGNVIKTELDKKSIFRIKVSENFMAERFTFPAVREGSIVEYSYTERSPFVLSFHSWPLQDIYPCLWSEYKAIIPSVFSYSAVPHSALPFCIQAMETNGAEKTFHWAARDVPALKEKPFTTTIKNYLARVDVRITGFESQNLEAVRNVWTNQISYYVQEVRAGGMLSSWLQLDRLLLKNDHFGADLHDNNSWLDNDMKEITAGAADDLAKARKIYAFVRDHFACNTNRGCLMTNTLKSVYKARGGNVAELNLVLTAMLVHERLTACPIVLSTRSNGFINEFVPQASTLDYVICKFRHGTVSYYLDASEPNLAFGQLPLECYNDYDIVVDTAGRPLLEDALSADSLTEQKKVVVFLTNGEKEGLDGSVQCFPGMAEAMDIRKKMKEEEGEKKFREQIRTGSAAEITISDLEFDSLKVPDKPLAINFYCHLAAVGAAEKLYFIPTLVDRMTENPFKDDIRTYPVEMPYKQDVNFILTMDVPNGYVVEELPKSEKISMTAGGYFEYVLSQDGDQVHFRTRLRLMKANYEALEYPILRQFFASVVEKENEQIVFKKKK